MHEGKAVIFDVNKTVGIVSDESVGAARIAEYLAPAIVEFLPAQN